MIPELGSQGYTILREFTDLDLIQKLREEMDAVAKLEQSTCVRHLRAKSEIVEALAFSLQVQGLLGKGWIPVRSILFDKNQSLNWPVAWHQDLTIAVKEKVEVDGYGPWSEKEGVIHVHAPENVLQNMVTIRLHLDSTPATNGALRVIPGSHKLGKLDTVIIPNLLEKNSEVVCDCDAGDLLVMSPLILHASHKSQVPSRRRIIHIEYARESVLDSSLEWHESRVMQR